MDPDEEVGADATSVSDLLHMLERTATAKRNRLQERDRPGPQPGDHDAL